jgi:hypothetical protein
VVKRLEQLAEMAGRALVRLPGVAAFCCAVAGAYELAGVGVALLVAAGMFLLVDRRMP